jgi:3-phosphoshikimate 1-carboxyvinyltransferase
MKIKSITDGQIWEITAPPSKSFMNRALIISALANGKSILNNPIYCDDTNYMINALKLLGVKIKTSASKLEIVGRGGKFKLPKKPIFVGNSGTAFRFLVSLSVMVKGTVIIDGDKRMRKRPIVDLLNTLEQLGAKVESNLGYPPIKISGKDFKGGIATINSNVSSQFISSLLMVTPYSEKRIELILKGKITSKPYLDITMYIMKKFGAKIKNNNYESFIVSNRKKYNPTKYIVEGDFSNASYFMAAAAITKSKMRINGLNTKSLQGDIKFLSILEQLGCETHKGKNYIEVIGKEIKPISIDMSEMPDIVQTLATILIFSNGKSYIKNIDNLRFKECDRIYALSTELIKIGVWVKEMKSGLQIEPKKIIAAPIETYNDHRMAMSFSIAGLKIKGITIKNPTCVNKSFPNYWNIFRNTFYQ